MRTREAFWTVAGSAVVAVGAGLTGVYAFAGRVAIVFVGFSMFVFGYWLVQTGVHEDPGNPLRVASIPSLRGRAPIRVAIRTVAIAAGVFGLALGLTLFGRSIVTFSFRRALYGGVSIVVGYTLTHYGLDYGTRDLKAGDTLAWARERLRGHDFNADHPLGVFAGLALTSVSLSSGFIWAYRGLIPHSFLAAAGAWVGYMLGHYATTGDVVDDFQGQAGYEDEGSLLTENGWRWTGVMIGAAGMVAGVYAGAVYVRAGNHLLANVGGGLFLGGYVLAHYAATDHPL